MFGVFVMKAPILVGSKKMTLLDCMMRCNNLLNYKHANVISRYFTVYNKYDYEPKETETIGRVSIFNTYWL